MNACSPCLKKRKSRKKEERDKKKGSNNNKESSGFYRRSACRRCTRRQRQFIPVRACVSRGSFGSICFSTSVCSCFYSCRLLLMTGRAPPTPPVVSASEQTAALRSGAPSVFTLAPLQAGSLDSAVAGGGQIALIWNRGWRVWG